MHQATPQAGSGRQLVRAGLLVLALAGCWAGWLAWDRTYDLDPRTGAVTGPYELWQIVGCGLCLVALVVLGLRRLPVGLVIAVTPIVITGSFSMTPANVTNPVGPNLWPLGAIYVFMIALPATAVVAALTALLGLDARPESPRRDRRGSRRA